MLTVRCKLSFTDGRTVEGQVEARSPGADYTFLYSGAVQVLARRPEQGTPADLELFFRLASYQSDATLQVFREGDYELKSNQARL